MGIILASQSPRRKELLELAGIEHRVVVSAVDEVMDADLDVAGQVQDLAIQKACAVADLFESETVIGADTIVVCDGKILGKPKNEEDAFNTLKNLSGRKHQVMTGVSIINKEKELLTSFVNITDVEFYYVTDEWILNYIKSGEPMDKAGSYGIQGCFAAYVDGIDGDYYNVVGLPVSYLYQQLKELC